MSLFHKLGEKAGIHSQSAAAEDLGKSQHGVPDLVMRTVDKYVDSESDYFRIYSLKPTSIGIDSSPILRSDTAAPRDPLSLSSGIKPTLVPRLEAEIASFQSKTLDSLDYHLKEAFHSIFFGGFSSLGSESRRREIAPNSFSDQNLEEEDQDPSDYGELGLPFAALADDLSDVLTQDFDPLKNADPQAREAYLKRDAAHQAALDRSEQSGNLLSVRKQVWRCLSLKTVLSPMLTLPSYHYL